MSGWFCRAQTFREWAITVARLFEQDHPRPGAATLTDSDGRTTGATLDHGQLTLNAIDPISDQATGAITTGPSLGEKFASSLVSAIQP